jgi:hypothetical protein
MYRVLVLVSIEHRNGLEFSGLVNILCNPRSLEQLYIRVIVRLSTNSVSMLATPIEQRVSTATSLATTD